MIPVGLVPLEFVLNLLAYLAVTLFWMIWLLRLALAGDVRWRLRRWRGPIFALFTAVALYSIWSVYDLRRALNAFAAEQQASFHPKLTQDQRLGGIDMVAGTQLRLGLARELESFDIAQFPQPILIGGVEALHAARYLRMHTNDAYQTTGFTPENLRLTGVGVSEQQDWRCDASQVIVFETYPNGTIKAFQSCFAAVGNLIEGEPLPKSAEIIVTEGSLYLDGQRGADRWIIHLPQDASLQLNGVTQTGGALLLDAERKVIKQIP